MELVHMYTYEAALNSTNTIISPTNEPAWDLPLCNYTHFIIFENRQCHL